MNDFSLHILDLVENSLSAGANDIVIVLMAKQKCKLLIIRDNGRGTTLSSSQLVNPFYTTRTTRRVGLGLAMMEHVARLCEGWIKIVPLKPKGMVVIASFAANHWNLPPDGRLADTMLVLIAANPQCRFRFYYNGQGHLVELDNRELIDLTYSEKKRRLQLAFSKLGGNEHESKITG